MSRSAINVGIRSTLYRLFSLLLIVCIVSLLTLIPNDTVHASSFHTITIDGELAEWATDELVIPDTSDDSPTQSSASDLQLTWDAENIYVSYRYHFSTTSESPLLYLLFDVDKPPIDFKTSLGLPDTYQPGTQNLSELFTKPEWFKPVYTTTFNFQFLLVQTEDGVHFYKIEHQLDFYRRLVLTDITDQISLFQGSGTVELGILWYMLNDDNPSLTGPLISEHPGILWGNAISASLNVWDDARAVDAIPDNPWVPQTIGGPLELGTKMTLIVDSDHDGYPDENINPTNPGLVILNPVNGTRVKSANLTVSGLASDNLGLERVEWSIDGTEWTEVAVDLSGLWQYNYTLTNEVTTFLLRATDDEGKQTTRTTSVYLDIAPPAPIQNLTIMGGERNATIYWTINNEPDFSHYTVYYSTSPFNDTEQVRERNVEEAKKNAQTGRDDNFHFVSEPLNRTTNFTLFRGLDPDRIYYIAVTAVDTSGNENTSVTPVEVQSFRVERSIPKDRYLETMLGWVIIGIFVFIGAMVFFAFYRKNLAYAYITPALTALLLLTFFPVFFGFFLSFTDRTQNNAETYNIVGFDNFIRVFQEPDFQEVLFQNLQWTVICVFFHVMIGLLLAVVMNRKFFGRPIYRALLLLPWAVPSYITALIWRGMFDMNFGALNQLGEPLGLVPINWLGTLPYAFWAVLITNIWLGFSFMMIMFSGGLQSIPEEVYEAADIDGFTRMQKFRHLTFPLLKPTLIPASLLGVIWTFNMFNVIWLVTGGGPNNKTDILITFVYRFAFRQPPYYFGLAAAWSVMIFFMLLVFSIYYSNVTKAYEAVATGSSQEKEDLFTPIRRFFRKIKDGILKAAEWLTELTLRLPLNTIVQAIIFGFAGLIIVLTFFNVLPWIPYFAQRSWDFNWDQPLTAVLLGAKLVLGLVMFLPLVGIFYDRTPKPLGIMLAALAMVLLACFFGVVPGTTKSPGIDIYPQPGDQLHIIPEVAKLVFGYFFIVAATGMIAFREWGRTLGAALILILVLIYGFTIRFFAWPWGTFQMLFLLFLMWFIRAEAFKDAIYEHAAELRARRERERGEDEEKISPFNQLVERMLSGHHDHPDVRMNGGWVQEIEDVSDPVIQKLHRRTILLSMIVPISACILFFIFFQLTPLYFIIWWIVLTVLMVFLSLNLAVSIQKIPLADAYLYRFRRWMNWFFGAVGLGSALFIFFGLNIFIFDGLFYTSWLPIFASVVIAAIIFNLGILYKLKTNEFNRNPLYRDSPLKLRYIIRDFLSDVKMSAAKITEGVGTHSLLLLFVVICLVPVLWVVGTSFKEGQSLADPNLQIFPTADQFTWQHYVDVINDPNLNFLLYLRNSAIVAAGTTLLGVFLSITAAYAFSRYNFTGKKTAMLSFLVVQMFPGTIIIVPFFILLRTLGLIDNFLGLVLAYSVTALPLCIWMIKGFFDTIPYELEEAAQIDGCTQFGAFVRVVIPLSTPAIAVTALFSFMTAWNEFLLALTFMLSSKNYTIPVRLASFITPELQLWGNFSAMAILVSIPVVIMFIVTQRYLISGMTAGGVKG